MELLRIPLVMAALVPLLRSIGGQPVSQAFLPLQVEILPQGRESPIFKQFFKDWK